MSRRRRETLILVVVGVVVVVVGGMFLAGDRGSTESENIAVMEAAEDPEAAMIDPPMITYVEGLVESREVDSGGWLSIDFGDELDRGSVIRTGSNSYADIRIQQGTVMRVEPDTQVALARLDVESVDVDVTDGTVVSRVEGLFNGQNLRIQSDGAVAGVRGTELVVAVTNEQTTVFGVTGSVEVRSRTRPERTVELSAAQKSEVPDDGTPSAASPMSEEELVRFRRVLDSLNEQQVLIVADRITFLPDSADLTETSEEELEAIYEQLRQVDYDIEIVGHTADIGARDAQLRLSTERAESVLRSLVDLGIEERRLRATGAGGSRPMDMGDDPDSLRRNRRVEFRAVTE